MACYSRWQLPGVTRAVPPSPLRDFLSNEAAGGYMLMAAATGALVIANSPVASDYFQLLHLQIGQLSLLHWINDGLMPLFFLLVGLELKREVLEGQLATNARRILPGAAALAGMAVPALIYLALTYNDPLAARGWAVPAATDIAFALGVLALLGRRIPPSLKIFLTAVAIVDDLGAIVIIALVFTAGLDFGALGFAAAGVVLLIGLNRMKVTALTPYLVIGLGVWYATLQSGIHATLAGVAVALTVPLRSDDAAPSPLYRLEHALHPLIAFGVVPVFGFANAGLSFEGLTPVAALDPVPLGVVLALFLGKQFGVFGAIWVLCRAGLADMPAKATWRQLYGVALLCGIGFTMSLFIAGLSFGDGSYFAESAKLGIIVWSLLSALAGWALLARSQPEKIT